ncbi:hypothetical protein F5Y12DRAFT_307375 [Xylaria sp. FL1777]|nr:hypothetical protein F5Y12DRAFT_307375 [Xylaria sp. FL1777]
MRLPLVLAALSFAVTTRAQNFASYVPECALPCVEQTLNSTKLCAALDDNKCLCTNFSPIILSSRICFVQACNTSIAQTRSEITSGWQKFCNDSGIPVNLTDWDSSLPSSFPNPFPSPFPTSSTTPSISPTASSPASNDTISITASGLSTGAKAGIGVGAGVGSLVVISGLVFVGFRLGRSRKRENNAGDSEGTHPDHEQSTTLSSTPNWTTAEGGGDVWPYKPQTPVAELATPSSPHAELPAHDIKELQTNEHPAELWHGVMPSELSADGEIPRIASTART